MRGWVLNAFNVLRFNSKGQRFIACVLPSRVSTSNVLPLRQLLIAPHHGESRDLRRRSEAPPVPPPPERSPERLGSVHQPPFPPHFPVGGATSPVTSQVTSGRTSGRAVAVCGQGHQASDSVNLGVRPHGTAAFTHGTAKFSQLTLCERLYAHLRILEGPT